MTIVEMRERAASLARFAVDRVAEYPEGEIPTDVAGEVEAWLAEAKDLGEKIRKSGQADALRQQAIALYEEHWKGQGARTPDVMPTTDTKKFPEFLDYLKAVYVAGKGGRRDQRLRLESEDPELAKDLQEGVGAAGGFLVPEEFIPQLLTKAGERAIVRPRAAIIPMARRQINIPALDYAHGGTGHSAFYGGVRAYWTEESGTKEEVDAYFRKIQLIAWKLAGWVPIEDELLQDSAISLPPLLTALFGGAVAWTEDYSFLCGDGVAKPMGVLNAPVTIVVPRQAANQFGWIDIVNMVARLQPGASPVWVMAQSVLPQLFTIQDPNGNYIWVPAHGVAGAASPAPGTLLGYPVIFTEKLPALGATGDVMLADFSYYVIGDRASLTIAYSTDYRFIFDETAWRFTHRVAGQPWLNAPVTLQEGTTISPFVILGIYS